MKRKKAHVLLMPALLLAFLLFVFGARVSHVSSFMILAVASPGSFRVGEIQSNDSLPVGSPELVLVGNEALKANTPPITVTPKVLGAIMGQIDTDTKPEIIQYQIEEGDTPSLIAEKFSISLHTVLWANNLQANSALQPGKNLVILPVSGALHLVRPGDTISEIAAWYKGDVKDIVGYNQLATETEIFTGDILVIPNGVMPKIVPQGRLTPLPHSYFIWPLPAPHRMTQGLHPFNAVDLSNGVCQDSVYAAAGGIIQKTGYTSIGGKYVRILHPNGVVTYYGHLSALLTVSGARVFQGQTIGYTGYSGYTIPRGPAGCHLHFEVRGGANPFVR